MKNNIESINKPNKDKIKFFEILITKTIYSDANGIGKIYHLFLDDNNNFNKNAFNNFVNEIIDNFIMKSSIRINYETLDSRLNKDDLEYIINSDIEKFRDNTGFCNEISVLLTFNGIVPNADIDNESYKVVKNGIKGLYISKYIPLIQKGFSDRVKKVLNL